MGGDAIKFHRGPSIDPSLTSPGPGNRACTAPAALARRYCQRPIRPATAPARRSAASPAEKTPLRRHRLGKLVDVDPQKGQQRVPPWFPLKNHKKRNQLNQIEKLTPISRSTLRALQTNAGNPKGPLQETPNMLFGSHAGSKPGRYG